MTRLERIAREHTDDADYMPEDIRWLLSLVQRAEPAVVEALEYIAINLEIQGDSPRLLAALATYKALLADYNSEDKT